MRESDTVYSIKTNFIKMINYVYLEYDEITRKAFIVDPSWNYEKIINIIHTLDLDIKAVFMTHSHFDHTNLAGRISRYTGAATFMSKIEIENYHFMCTNLNMLNDCDVISIGNMDVECMLTPGHTDGSMCYITKNSFYTGDTVFLEGCGICQNQQAAEQMYESLEKIRRNVNWGLSVYPGHFYAVKRHAALGEIMDSNLYFQFETKEEFVKYRMRKGQKNLFKFV